ncbi:FAD-binding oxidoreductase [Sphingomicrobium marinum]|uniref:FAD-binding oxidoreductase n=1 Tax=Sphingomicrobium marinum TaxID=1227950 RepID=UPI002240497D|nr:FAD-binding oxidoreductase [Sphingomicrobium marinum]
MGKAAFIDDLRARFGERAVVTDAATIEPWLTDWRGRWTGKALAMLEPGSTQDVAAMVSACIEAGVAMVPQGGNSSMVGGATPSPEGDSVIFSLRRMNAIRTIDPDARVAVVEAGVILQNLHDAALAKGLRFPLTLGAKGSATIGGLISTNAGGTQVLKFGTMRGLTLGLEAVLPDGSIHDGLSGLKKDNRGPSIDQLLIGAEGTLGIVTAARLQLVAAPVQRGTAFVGLANPRAALDLLYRLGAATDRIECFEILPHDSLVAALEHLDVASPLNEAQPWYALIEATQDSAEAQAPSALLERLLGEEMEAGRISDAVIAASDAQSEALWRLRDSLSDAEKAHYGAATQHDVSVPIDAMPAFLEEVKQVVEAQWPGVMVSGFGHLGDGNIHLHVRAMERGSNDWRETEAPAIERRVHDLVTAHSGSISAEHGIGQMKRDELARLGEPARLNFLRSIKAAIDPDRLMNPGKLIP